MRAVLAVASVVVVTGAMWVFARDLSHDPRRRLHVVVEAAVPLVGATLLVWWAWSGL